MRIKKAIAAILASVMFIGATGCSEAKNEKAKDEMEDAFESYISKVLAGKDASDYVDAKHEAAYEVTPVQEEILMCTLKRAEYKIIESEASAKDKEGSITVELRYPDAYEISQSYFDDEMEDLLADIEGSSRKFFAKKKVKIGLAQVDGEWLVTKKADIKMKKALDEIVDSIYLEPYNTSVPQPQGSGMVGISLPTKDLMRWNSDGDRMKKGLEKLGYEVDLQYAGNDVSKQRIQVMNMIDSGCGVLVIAPIDPVSLNDVLDMAQDAEIPVISYDRLICGTLTLDYYVTFDSYMTGVMQAQYLVEKLKLNSPPDGKVYNIELTAGDPSDINAQLFYNGAYEILLPYISQGLVNIPSGQIEFRHVATDAWSVDRARGRAENIIGTYYQDGRIIDAWLCSNDSTALGVIAALDATYSGPYPLITGQDCEAANVKNIISGKQAMSVFKDTRVLVDQTVLMVDEILTGQPVACNDTSTFNNGVMNVNSYLCSPTLVDADNYKTVLIESGYYREEDLI